MPGLFITATGTEAGKTFVSSGLIRACRRAGRAVDALKPVISGFDPLNLEGSDTAVLLEALGEPVAPGPIARVSPWRFRAPLSPDMAAAREGQVCDFDSILNTCRATLALRCLTIIEGVGGVMVPFGPGLTVLDLMEALAVPIVLVTPTGLGAISHLLTALEALKSRGLAPAAIVLNESPGSTVPTAWTLETLAGFCGRADLFVLHRETTGLASGNQDGTFDAILAACEFPAGVIRAS